jgi:hypothetical protein
MADSYSAELDGSFINKIDEYFETNSSLRLPDDVLPIFEDARKISIRDGRSSDFFAYMHYIFWCIEKHYGFAAAKQFAISVYESMLATPGVPNADYIKSYIEKVRDFKTFEMVPIPEDPSSLFN